MIICIGCRKEMRCDKNSVGADFGDGHVYPADRFKCPDCGAMVLVSNRAPSFDPDYTFQDEYLDMNKHKNEVKHITDKVFSAVDEITKDYSGKKVQPKTELFDLITSITHAVNTAYLTGYKSGKGGA
jgi:hypothetical protein